LNLLNYFYIVAKSNCIPALNLLYTAFHSASSETGNNSAPAENAVVIFTKEVRDHNGVIKVPSKSIKPIAPP
jgi:hypothetical protein